jgi:APA family basic amino acid/polyamine antiporter
VTEIQTAGASEGPGLRKTLGTFDGIALLIGIVIGSGIYTTPALVSGYFGSFSSLITVWIVVGVFVMIGGLIYAELGTRLPATGGEYVYITRCFGPFAGFMFGWAQLFIIRTSPAAGLALIAADYVGVLTELSPRGHTAVALGIIAALGLFNYVGMQWASLFQKVTTVIKVGFLALFAAVGVALMSGLPNLLGTQSAPTTGLSPAGNLIAALMLIIFTHTGFDRVGYVAGEMKDPKKAIPRSMLVGITIVIALYWSLITVYHYTLGMEGMQTSVTPAADVGTVMIGAAGASIVAVMAIVSAIGSINGTMMSATRVYYAMARDGLFFRWLDFVHPKFKTPSRAILVHCAWAAVILVVRGSFEAIAAGMVFAILIFYTLTTLALFKLRREDVGGEGAFRMPFYPLLPSIYLVGIVGLLVLRAVFDWQKSLVDFAFIATGLPISFFWLSNKRGNHSSDV